jgi:hypothetical protein
MYVVLGNEIVDSEELKVKIEENSDFKIEKDLSKGTKREDTVAYQLSIKIDTLNEYLEEDFEVEEIEAEDLFDEYMSISDEAAMEIEDLFEEGIIVNARAYKWDRSDETVKLVISIGHQDLGELKLRDVTNRLLNQVD